MNELLNQFAKQPLAVKIGILVGVLLAMVGAEYQFFYIPQKQELAKQRKKSAELSVKKSENQAIADNLPRFQEEVSILNEQLKQAVALLPSEADIHSLLRQLSITAKKTNIDLLSFRPAGRASRGFYSELSMDLKLSGTYHDVAMFIDQVGKLTRIINVSNIVFSNLQRRGTAIVVTVDCRATTYMFRSG